MKSPIYTPYDDLAERSLEPLSLIDLLRWRAEQHAGREVYTFLSDGRAEGSTLSYGELDLRARAIGAWLQDAGMSGERVLLLYPPGLEYITAFFGCLYAGAVAVPAYPPRPNRGFDRLQAIIADARPAAALTTSVIMSQIQARMEHAPGLKAIFWGKTDTIGEGCAEGWREPNVGGQTLAFLQYTSGSTARPKGVMVNHRHLLHNERMIQQAFQQSEESIIVGWLPLFHDMGLIGNVLQPLYVGAKCILLSPLTFLQRPASWLETISRYRATTSGGPNFAYDLCVRKMKPEQCESLDLSSWSVAFNGAEPIHPETLERFADAFKPCGFRREAFYPCYGLAEATLFVSGGMKMSAPSVRIFQRKALEQNRVLAASVEDEDARPLVGCGHAWLEQEVRIVEPHSGIECTEGEIGEIWVAGASVASGYWNQTEETERTFHAHLSDTCEGPFLRTGDLGFVDDRELFITGRLKDLIIIRGRNHYPQDIELTVERTDAALRLGEGAAFSADIAGEERLVIVQEVVRNYQEHNLAGIVEAIRQAVSEDHELQAYAIVLIKPGTILKTSSGKIQRRAIKEAFLKGTLEVIFQWRVAEASEAGAEVEANETTPETLEEIREWMASKVASKLGIERAAIDITKPVTRYGLDSLAAIELVHLIEASLGASLPVASFLEDVSIADLADRVLAERDLPQVSLSLPSPVGERSQAFPLSRGQVALWFLHRLAPESAAYNVVGAARVRGLVEVGLLKQAFQTLIDRHPALRVRFENREGAPLQIVEDGAAVSFREEDVSICDEDSLRRRIEEDAHRPFDLESGPVFRVSLFSRGDGEHVLLLAAHHIVIDLWSLAVLVKELDAVLEAEATGRRASLPTPKVSYEDYVSWQESALTGERGARLWKYWQRQLEGELPVLDLAADHPRPPVQTYVGASESIKLNREITARLGALARRYGATLYTVLLAAYGTLLSRHTSQEEVLIGSPTSGRLHTRYEPVVGYFVNPVVIRLKSSAGQSFRQLLSETRETVLRAFEHQEYPFALLVDRLQPERDPSRSPLFQTMFVLQKSPASSDQSLAAFGLNEEGARLKLGPLMLDSYKLAQQVAQFDLTMAAAEVEDGISVSLQYNTDLFEAATIKKLLGRFKVLLEGILADPEQQIAELPVLDAAERQQLLQEFNETRRDYPAEICLHQLFERQAEKTPEAVAVMCRDEHLTYRQLNVRADRLAKHLRKLGVAPEMPVGILMERGIELVIGLLGIMKAGGVYLPLDPSYPVERLFLMLEDARATVLLTEPHLTQLLPQYRGDVVCFSDFSEQPAAGSSDGAEVQITERNLAYLIYTSGSTGKPKGTAIEHHSAATLVHWAREIFSADELEGVLFSTSICFDLSVFELFVPLSYGGKVIVVKDALELLASDHGCAITLINTVPSALWELVRNGGVPDSVLTINLAGEPLGRDLVEQAYMQRGVRRVFNLYGPSEDTTYSTFTLVSGGVEAQPTIGKPIANTQVYLAGRHQLMPTGVPGELLIGGDGLARGYLYRADLTAERFIPNVFAERPGARLYKTGDLARYLPDGDIEFLGRLDHQVKIRGFRIELGEIEATLSNHPAVKDAVVVAREDASGEKRLVAYIVSREGETADAGELRVHLRQTLPHYMVPQTFVMLEAMPLTRNGKVDRKALPALNENGYESTREFEKPQTPVEVVVAGIWADVLGLEQVGATDNFFDLGGHSLKTTQVISRLSNLLQVQLPVRSVFEAPTVRDLSLIVEEALKSRSTDAAKVPIQRLSREGDLPVSFAQQRLWFLNRLEPESAAYNISFTTQFTGRLNVPALEQGLNEIIRRHEALRTTFENTEEGPVQVVARELVFALPVIDLRRVTAQGRERLVRRLAVEEARRPFDLERGPLVRMALLRLDDEECMLLFSMHHIVSDGWSLGVLIRELAAHYEAYSSAQPSPLPELHMQYADFASWQREQEEALQPQLSYWKQQLSGAPALLELPTDHPRPAVQGSRGASEPFALPREMVGALHDAGRREGATLFMTLLAGLQALLSRYSGQRDILVGTPVANRSRADIESLIGCFVNTLVIRTDLSGNPTFSELLRRVREVALEAYANQDVPFERLVGEVQVERDVSRTPLFQVMLVLQNAPLGSLEWSGLRLRPEETGSGTAKFDLMLQMTENEEGLTGKWEYNADLFDADTIRRMATHFRALLESVADSQQRLSELPLLTEAERAQLLVEWNETAREFPPPYGLHEMFERAVEQAADAVAVLYEEERLSFAALNSRANQLARHLRELGVGPEVRVGVMLERSLEMVVALLAVLKAGAAYVPLDPSYPAERLEWMLEDARVEAVLTQARLTERVGAHAARFICLDADCAVFADESTENLNCRVEADNLAYVIYTSGSTGKPKGAMISHGGLHNYLSWATRNYDVASGHGAPVHSSLSFDLTVTSLFTPLLVGRPVHLVREEVGIEGLREALETANGFSLVKITPAHLEVLSQQWQQSDQQQTPDANGLERRTRAAARVLVIGGEALQGESLRWWQEHAPATRLVNEYGPTETVVGCVVYEAGAEHLTGGVPIGRAISNTSAYVLDAGMEPVPIGVAGELYIGGAGVGRGYLHRAELTAERFVPHPFGVRGGERLYRTGDLARWRVVGELEYLGRLDDQVKIRGYRIELGEVETVLRAQPSVTEAAVVVREDAPGEKRLVAYVVGDGTLSAADLRAYLQAKLPGYMLPSAFVLLEQLPLTLNGKVDRKALPPPERVVGEEQYVAPRTPTEELLADIWAQVLRIERVGVNDNFFDLGGDSILIIQVIVRANRAGLQLTSLHLFSHPTVARLASVADGIAAESTAETSEQSVVETSAQSASPLPLIVKHDAGAYTPSDFPKIKISQRDLDALTAHCANDGEGDALEDIYPLSPLQQGMLFHALDAPDSGLYLNQQSYTLRGELDVAALRRAYQQVVERHQILRTAFIVGANGDPFQVVYRHLTLPWEEFDWSELPPSEQQEKIEALLRADRERGFEVNRAPLLRMTLVRLGDDDYQFTWSFHLILLDGWSSALIFQEVFAIYAALSRGQSVELARPTPYGNYIDWLSHQDKGEAEAYWRQTLRGFTTPTALGGDRTVGLTEQQEYYREQKLLLEEDATDALRSFARLHQLTLNTLFQGAWALLIGRRSGTEDVVFGSVVSGRQVDFPGVESTVGLFINTLPVTVKVSPEAPLLSWLHLLQTQQAEARRFESSSLVDIQGWSAVPRGQLMFESVFIFQNIPLDLPLSEPDRRLRVCDMRFVERNNYPLTVVAEPGQRLLLKLVYNSRRFDDATIGRMLEQYRRLLAEMVAGSADNTLASFAPNTEGERKQLIESFNQSLDF